MIVGPLIFLLYAGDVGRFNEIKKHRREERKEEERKEDSHPLFDKLQVLQDKYMKDIYAALEKEGFPSESKVHDEAEKASASLGTDDSREEDTKVPATSTSSSETHAEMQRIAYNRAKAIADYLSNLSPSDQRCLKTFASDWGQMAVERLLGRIVDNYDPCRRVYGDVQEWIEWSVGEEEASAKVVRNQNMIYNNFANRPFYSKTLGTQGSMVSPEYKIKPTPPPPRYELGGPYRAV